MALNDCYFRGDSAERALIIIVIIAIIAIITIAVAAVCLFLPSTSRPMIYSDED
jgi:flagellar basal body-associated protein FliL